MKYLNQISEDFNLKNDLSPVALSRFPEVFTLEEQSIDEDEMWKELVACLDEAAIQFVESRTKEGETLKQDMIQKLDGMLGMVDYIESVSPSLVEVYRQRLEDKVKE